MSSSSKQRAVTKTGSSLKERTSDDEFMAAAIGDIDWLKQSVKQNGSINFDKNGLAALHLASLHGRLDCVKMLVEKYKHDVNLKSSTGWRPMHLAISNQTGKRSFAVLEYLLSKGADFSVANDDGITPMHQAASEGHIQCLKALIDRGAKIYVKDNRGHTPLDLAKLWGHRQCARILATEQWHQEKDEVAKELSKLKRTKMITELNNLSLLEDQHCGIQHQSEQAYQVWLNTKGLQADETGHVNTKKKGEAQSQSCKQLTPVTPVSGLYKPNSIADTRILGKSSIKSTKQLTPPQQRQRTMDSFPDSTEYYTIYEKPETPSKDNKLVMDKKKKASIMAKKHFVKEKWNFSPQCELLHHYQKDLQDCYPRNPITKLPHRRAAPKYLATHKNVPISAFSSPDAYKTERTVVFQPETILDAQTKVKYSEDVMFNKPQVFLHLTSDLGSQMFHRGLYVNPFKEESSQSSHSSLHILSPIQSRSESIKLTPSGALPTEYTAVGGVLPI